jgi:GT2 family glycosyltransferase
MVDIVIVNWNSGTLLKNCLHSIALTRNQHLIDNIFVIDNNSHDRSADEIESIAKVTVVRNDANNGFAKAVNQGFRLCKSRYVLLLNPDTRLFTNTISDCVSFMGARPEVDILGCRLLDENGRVSKSCARFPTAATMMFDSIGLSKLFPRVFTPAPLMIDWDHDESRFVDQVMGAFMFMRTTLFSKIGYFDERFFVYYEELDYSKKLQETGGKSFYNKDIQAVHTGEGTTESVKGFRLFLNLKSRLQYAKKHFSRLGYVGVWLTTFFIEPFLRCIQAIVRGRFRDVKDIIKGYRLLIGGHPPT